MAIPLGMGLYANITGCLNWYDALCFTIASHLWFAGCFPAHGEKPSLCLLAEGLGPILLIFTEASRLLYFLQSNEY